ncbi:DUF6512 family protein [Gudongella sp. DL1XJH-153]|uniref:DUF6512 family protein n=1 Tax=Gudongella sp. DL1XJH-153 TaxID=3409804 RepID=UPI003BB55F25
MKAYSDWASARNFGLVLLILMGLAFHELYKATGITFLGIISPVNESKWEHWKMAFFPMLIIGGIEYFLLGLRGNNYLFALAAGAAVFLIVTFGGIEIYEMIFAKAHIVVHVVSFLLGALAGQITRYYVMSQTRPSLMLLIAGITVIGLMFSIFFRFTFNPPMHDYFRDSITGSYGIYKIR